MPAVGRLGQQLGCLDVGEVAHIAENTRLEQARVWPVDQPLALMVGFDNDQVGLAQRLAHLVAGLAGVENDADVPILIGQKVADRLGGVVRDVER